MEKKSTIVGKPAMAIAEGQDLGVVMQLILDADAKRVTHLVLGDGKGVAGHKLAAPIDKVVGIGRDFMTIMSKDDLVSVWKIGEGPGRTMADDEFIGLPVISSLGNIEGQVADFTFDTTTGAISEIAMADGPTIGSDRLLTIAAKGIFVNFNSEPVMAAAAYTPVQPQVQERPVVRETVVEKPAYEPPAPVMAPVEDITLPEEETPAQEAAEVFEQAEAQAFSEPVQEEDDELEEEMDYFVRRQSEFLLGRTVKKDILAADGSVLAAEGTEITNSVLKKVRKEGKLTELSLNA